jgi:aspartate/glutamate/aspartate-prephenate aminotransferase
VPLLKKKICEKLEKENNIKYTPDEIVLSNGAKQSVWQGVMACCSPGDEVVIPAPFWVSYPEMARLAGAEPVVVETDSSQGFLMTAEQLRGALNEKSRLLILCSPSNPSGAVYTEEQLQEIAKVVRYVYRGRCVFISLADCALTSPLRTRQHAREHPRLVVLSDEIYEYIVYGNTKHVSFASLPGMFERTLTVNGFSKAYAMTGWRLGYLAAPKVFAKACAVIQSQSTSGASSIAQHAALAALDMGPYGGEVVHNMVVEFEKRRDYVVSRLAKMKGVKIVEPRGAFYALPDVSSVFGKSIGGVVLENSDDVVKMLIEKANVAPVPGEAFGCPDCIRISYACSMEELKEACDRMEREFFDKVE